MVGYSIVELFAVLWQCEHGNEEMTRRYISAQQPFAEGQRNMSETVLGNTSASHPTPAAAAETAAAAGMVGTLEMALAAVEVAPAAEAAVLVEESALATAKAEKEAQTRKRAYDARFEVCCPDLYTGLQN